jgi:hypothetical protein
MAPIFIFFEWLLPANNLRTKEKRGPAATGTLRK